MIDGLFSPMHLLVIAIIALVVLGPKRLPETGRALGKGLRELRNGLTESMDHNDETPRPAVASTVVSEPITSVTAVEHVSSPAADGHTL